MTRRACGLGALVFAAAFGLLAFCYASLPAAVAVLRNPITGRITSVAPKSLFIVFRVPAMNLIHALMALVMLMRGPQFLDPTRRAGYEGLFAGLLLTASFKALAEAFEIVAPPSFAPWVLRLITGAVIVLGIIFSFVSAKPAPRPWRELRLRPFDIGALAGLFAMYLWIVNASTRLGSAV